MKMNCDKLILAVLQGDDYPEVVEDLTQHGFYVTVLNSSGGFLKKRSVTVMIGVEDARVQEVAMLLKAHSTAQSDVAFQPGGVGMPAIPVQAHRDGVTMFTLRVDQVEKF